MPENTTDVATNDLDFLFRLRRLRKDFRDRRLSPIVDSLAPTAEEVEAALKAERDRAAKAAERERLRARLAELEGDAAPEPPSAMLGEIARAVEAPADAPYVPVAVDPQSKVDGRKTPKPPTKS